MKTLGFIRDMIGTTIVLIGYRTITAEQMDRICKEHEKATAKHRDPYHAAVEMETGRTQITLTRKDEPVAILLLHTLTRDGNGTSARFEDATHFMRTRARQFRQPAVFDECDDMRCIIEHFTDTDCLYG